MTEKIDCILRNRRTDIWSVPSHATVYDAVALMAEKEIGALLVVDEGRLVGVISERDYARKVILQGKHSKETPVHEIMTTHLVTVSREHSVDDCMRLMSDHRIRHLPVMEDDRLVGVVSIGDLVKAIITEQAQTIDQLHTYIGGGYPA
ncbi:MAG: CBS domain-containing protein [Bryobacteraceae bacterium]